jgi:hypothetical protein
MGHVTTLRERVLEVQRFCVTAVLQAGRRYFVANFPSTRKGKGRAQKKFNRRELAESYLQEARREWIRRGKVELGLDSALHFDVMRAAKILSDIPNGSLEKGALLLRMCVGMKELRGSQFEAPLERSVELSPRLYLGCVNEAEKHGVSLRQAVEGMLAGWLESEVERQVKERTRDEAREYKELVERNEKTKRKLAQIEEEDRLMELMGKHSRAYEDGRNSILMGRNRYQREWRRKRKEREAKEQSNGNGSSDLQ